MCFLCSNILYPSDIVLDKHGFHRLHPLVYFPVCGKINEHTVCVLVLRKFQLRLLVFIFFCQTAVDALSLLPIQKRVLIKYSTYQLAKGWVPSRLLAFVTLMYVNRLM